MPTLAIALLVSFAALPVMASEPIPANPPARWWKGNLHTHSLWSDGNHFPEMIAEWYREQGYHFLALSDHNTLSQGERWMAARDINKRNAVEAIDKYIARFGDDWVETRGSSADGTLEVRLKPLNEFRGLVEERGRFIMIQSEEISARFGKLPVHMNVANIREVIEPKTGADIADTIRLNLQAVNEQSERTGQPMLQHLNHPNFHYAITAEDIAQVIEEHFFEVYNGHPGVNQLGDAEHPSIERLWDIANAIRVAHLHAPLLLGLGTDDTHHYHGQGGSRPGRGWVMVRAKHLTPESLIEAMKAGDFYASSGVTLKDVRFDKTSKKLSLKIDGAKGATYTTQFIGTTRDFGKNDDPRKSDAVGKVLATSTDLNPSYTFKGDEYYVRAVVTSSEGAVDPSYEGQKKQAWTQPVLSK